MADERRTGSFYGGNGGGISSKDVDKKIENNNKTQVEERIQQHIVISKTEPVGQKAGDLWLVLTE